MHLPTTRQLELASRYLLADNFHCLRGTVFIETNGFSKSKTLAFIVFIIYFAIFISTPYSYLTMKNL